MKKYYTFAHNGITSDTNIWFTHRQDAINFRTKYFNVRTQYYSQLYQKNPDSMKQFDNTEELIDHVQADKANTTINSATEREAKRNQPIYTIIIDNITNDSRADNWLKQKYTLN